MARLLCIGAAVLDAIFHVEHLPAEAEKYRAERFALRGGGMAATAAVAAQRLGIPTALASRIGDDALGRFVVDELVGEGIDCSFIRMVPWCHSSLSAVLVDRAGERLVVNAKDANLPGETSWLPATLPPGVEAVLADSHWQAGSLHLLQLARRAGRLGILDADRPIESPELLAAATHVAFSARALRDTTGEADLEAGLLKCREQTTAWLGVTDGVFGAMSLHGEGFHRVPAFAVSVIDSNGAGDVWHGALAAGLIDGAGSEEAMRLANAAAALKCRQRDDRVGFRDRAEVEAFLAANDG